MSAMQDLQTLQLEDPQVLAVVEEFKQADWQAVVTQAGLVRTWQEAERFWRDTYGGGEAAWSLEELGELR
jgi:hypothetical protein